MGTILTLDAGWFDQTQVFYGDPMMPVLEPEDGFGDGVSWTGREMIATCATCPAFSMCDNRAKLRPPSVENVTLVINYGLKIDLETDQQVEIHSHQKSKHREAVTTTIDVFGFNNTISMDNRTTL